MPFKFECHLNCIGIGNVISISTCPTPTANAFSLSNTPRRGRINAGETKRLLICQDILHEQPSTHSADAFYTCLLTAAAFLVFPHILCNECWHGARAWRGVERNQVELGSKGQDARRLHKTVF